MSHTFVQDGATVKAASLDPAAIAQINAGLISDMRSGNIKSAAETINDMICTRITESSFCEKIIPSKPISTGELTRLPNTDMPAAIGEVEPEVKAPMSVSLYGSSQAAIVRGRRWQLIGEAVESPVIQQDLDTLANYPYDLRQVSTDQSLRYLSTYRDYQAVSTLMSIAGPTVNAVSPYLADTGQVLYRSLNAGLTRNTVVTILQSFTDNDHGLIPTRVLLNYFTYLELRKWEREEAGGDLSEKMITDGDPIANLGGIEWIVTNKQHLVPNGRLFVFADPKYLGVSRTFREPTAHIETARTKVNISVSDVKGTTFVNPYGFRIYDLTPLRNA